MHSNNIIIQTGPLPVKTLLPQLPTNPPVDACHPYILYLYCYTWIRNIPHPYVHVHGSYVYVPNSVVEIYLHKEEIIRIGLMVCLFRLSERYVLYIHYNAIVLYMYRVQ